MVRRNLLVEKNEFDTVVEKLIVYKKVRRVGSLVRNDPLMSLLWHKPSTVKDKH